MKNQNNTSETEVTWNIYGSSVLYKFGISPNGIKDEPKIRNEHTNGLFITYSEYNRIIRRKKLKNINENA